MVLFQEHRVDERDLGVWMQAGVRTEQAVARAFARAADSAEAYGLALQAIGESLGWPFGAAWEPAPLDSLTPRETEVLALMAEGQTNHAIAEQLVVTDRAVERHVTSIFEKLGLSAGDGGHRRVLAVLAYLRD